MMNEQYKVNRFILISKYMNMICLNRELETSRVLRFVQFIIINNWNKFDERNVVMLCVKGQYYKVKDTNKSSGEESDISIIMKVTYLI